MYTIAVTNRKGGVAKTTSSAAIAKLLSLLKYKCLCIDLDSQGDLTALMGYTKPDKGLADTILIGKSDEVEIYHRDAYIDVIPASNSLSDIIYELHSEGESKYLNRLSSWIEELKYDYVIIDNSPFITPVTDMTIASADLILSPIEVDNFSYDGLVDLLGRIRKINGATSRDTDFRVFFTKVKARTNLFKSLLPQYEQSLRDIFCRTYIRDDNAAKEAATEYAPIPEYAPKSNCCADYARLVEEVILKNIKTYTKLKKILGIKEK